MGINPWRSQKRATNHKPKNKNKQKLSTKNEDNHRESNPVPTLVLMKARHLYGESRGASSPKSNQSKQVQVTSMACVPDKCQATQKDTNPRGDHEPTTMTSLHPVTLLTNFALNFAYIK